MRLSHLTILRSPLTGAKINIKSAIDWYSEADLKTGILESTNGELFPVICGIPIFTEDETGSMALRNIQSGSADMAAYTLLNGQPLYWVEEPERTFQQLLYQFVGRWSADYFYYRRSDPSFISGLSSLRLARGQVGWAFDLGCGCGHNSDILARMLPGQKVIGFDSTFKLLYLARHFIAPDCDFICCDLEKGLPVTSAQAGTVLCSDTFTFLNNKWGSAREMLRLLREGGRLIVTRLLQNAPSHWNSVRFRLLPLEQYLPLFESSCVQVFSDQALRQAYLDAQPIAPVSQVHEQSCSLVVSKTKLPERAYDEFLDTYQPDQLYLNPLYVQSKGSDWQLVWPSQPYALDYQANSGYLPPTLELPEKLFGAPSESKHLEDWIRRRVLLFLPDRYGGIGSPFLRRTE